MRRYFSSLFLLLLLQSRFSDCSAQSITPNQLSGLLVWLKPDSVVKDVNNRVSSWVNVVGGANFNQATANRQPLWVANVWNGKPAILFDGSDVLNAGNAYNIGTSSRTIFIVAQSDSPTCTFYAKSTTNAASNRIGLINSGTGLTQIYYDNAGHNLSTGTFPTGVNIWSTVINKTAQNLKLYKNSSQVLPTVTGIQGGAYNFNSAFRFLLGAYNGPSDVGQSTYLYGYIAEVIIYNRALSDNERNQVNQYLSSKYAQQISLGPDIIQTPYSMCSVTLQASPGFTNYRWSTGDTAITTLAIAPGSYWVSATDMWGYETRDTINVSFIAMPDTVLCAGSALTIGTGLPGPYSHLWSPGADTSSLFTLNQPEIYSVKLTDTSGCFRTDTFIVILDSLQYNIGFGSDSTRVCSGQAIGLQNGNNLISSYSWSNGLQLPSIPVSASGYYSVTVTGLSGCQAKDTIFVTVKGVPPQVNFYFDTVCLGTATDFFDQSLIDTPEVIASLLWNFGGGNTDTGSAPSFAFANSGLNNVTLVAISAVGCSDTTTRSVPVISNPVASFSLLVPACRNNTYTFFSNSQAGTGDSILFYSWSFGDSTSDSPLKTPTHIYTSTGDKHITLTITTMKGCTAIHSDTLTVDSTAASAGIFSLNQPPMGYVVVSGIVNFSWYGSFNSLNYNLQIATDISFSNILIDTSVSGLNVSVLLTPQFYYWRVLAKNSCGEPTSSEIKSFTVIDLGFFGTVPLWLKADGQLVKDSVSRVNSWTNIIGGANFEQPIAEKQPLWVNNVWNGKPVIRFDGVNDFLNAGDAYNIGTNSRTVFIVCKANTRPYTFYAKSRAAGVNNRLGFLNDGTANGLQLVYHDNAVRSLTSGSSPTGVNIWGNEINRNLQNLKIYKNGSQFGSPVSGIQGVLHDFTSTFRFLLGAYNDGQDTGVILPLNGDIAEMIIYNNALSDNERNQVEQYLRFKYAPQINLGSDIEIKYGVCDTALNAGSFANIRWSTGQTTASIRVKESGTYWVTAQDVFGYITTDTVEVAIPYKGTNVGDSVIICLGDSVRIEQQILPSGAYNFLWSTGSTLNFIYASTQGTYTATMTDTLTPQCILSASPVFVKVDSFRLYSLLEDDTTMCAGNSIAVLSSQYPLDSFFWTTPATTVTTSLVTVDSGGSYSVVVTNRNGCMADDTIQVTRRWYAPNIDFVVSDVCDGTPVTFQNTTAIQGADTIRFWNWNFGDDSTSSQQAPSHLYIATGQYNVTVTLVTDSGCTGNKMDTVNVFPQPEAAINYNPQVICAGTTVEFTDNTPLLLPDTILKYWLLKSTDIFTSSDFTYNFPDEGLVSVIFIATTNRGCTDTVSQLLEVFPELAADFSFDSVCLGDFTEFKDRSSSFSVLTWLWNFGDGGLFSNVPNPVRKYQTAKTYNVNLTLTNAIGCIDTISKDVKIVAPPIASFADANACEGFYYSPKDSSISLNDTIAFWNWTIDTTIYTGQSPQHYFAKAGTYQVVLNVSTKTGNCKASATRQVTIDPNPIALFGFSPLYGEAPLEVTFNNQSTNASSYLWDFGDSFTSTEERPVHIYLENDTVNIILTAVSDAGCAGSYAKIFIVVPTQLDLSIDKVTATPLQQSDGSVEITVTVRMTNVGTRIITSAKLYALLGGGGFITEDWTDTVPMAPGAQRIYTFQAKFVVLGDKATYVCVEAREVNGGETEIRTDNNRACTTLNGAIQLVGPSPNPVSDYSVMGIILPKAGKVSIAIVNTAGQYVLEETELNLPIGRSDFEIPVHRMNAAEYFIRVVYNDEKFVRKFVLKK
ncbi:MAG: PKD domain-containing protein [Bacteroidota bacterium]